jgi:hypothetical protein
MIDDAVDHSIVCNKGDDLHPAAALGADHRVNLIHFADHLCPALGGDGPELFLDNEISSGRPYTPLMGREWDPTAGSLLPVWGDPFSQKYPAHQRLDLTGNRTLHLLEKLVILYFRITNLLDNKNISRYDHGPDYSERKDQQSIFCHSLFVGLYIPLF